EFKAIESTFPCDRLRYAGEHRALGHNARRERAGSFAMPEVIESLIDELSAASTSEDVYHVLDRRLGELGFERFAYHVLISSEGARKPMYLGTYPDTWARHYIANDYVNVDPVMPQATRGILPFNWADLYKSLAPKSRQRKVIDEAGDFGLPNGITVPDRKSTRLNSSHVKISYAVFCLK